MFTCAEVRGQHQSSSISFHLIFKTASLTELGTPWFNYTGSLVGYRDPPVSATPLLLQCWCVSLYLAFHMDSEDLTFKCVLTLVSPTCLSDDLLLMFFGGIGELESLAMQPTLDTYSPLFSLRILGANILSVYTNISVVYLTLSQGHPSLSRVGNAGMWLHGSPNFAYLITGFPVLIPILIFNLNSILCGQVFCQHLLVCSNCVPAEAQELQSRASYMPLWR